MTPFEDWVNKAKAIPIMDIVNRRGFAGLKRVGAEMIGKCPVCGGDDRFGVNVAENVFNCRGCEKGGTAIDFQMLIDGTDLVAACTTLNGEPPPRPKLNGKTHKMAAKKVVAESYPYIDLSGALRLEVLRIHHRNVDGTFVIKEDGRRKKSFSQRQPDPAKPGAWLYNIDGAELIPYRLPELVEAIASGRLVVIVEGEACVNAMTAIGVVATTASGGAGKWPPEFKDYFRDADVVLLPDADDIGWKHMTDIAVSLVGVARRIRIVVLPGLRPKDDIVDWLGSGHTREEFDALVAGAQDWAPPSSSTEEAPAFTDEAKQKPRRTSRSSSTNLRSSMRSNTSDAAARRRAG